jgi:hypothetical protein
VRDHSKEHFSPASLKIGTAAAFSLNVTVKPPRDSIHAGGRRHECVNSILWKVQRRNKNLAIDIIDAAIEFA